MTLSYRRVHPSGLTTDDVERWRELQDSNPLLESPFFCPELTLIVGDQREDAAVTVVEDGDGPIAFFPFQRGRLGLGGPIGGILSDHHGVIAAPNTVLDVPALLRASGLRRWSFAELVRTQPGMNDGITSTAPSPIVDLSMGLDAYLQERGQHTDYFKQARTKLRRLERQIGPVRFEARTTSAAALDELRTWKSAQYLASGFADLLAEPWVAGLTDQVMTTASPSFAGMLSALYADDQLIAAHLGMASRRVWHWWLPAYSQDYARFSPGRILLTMMLEHAPTIGLVRIDLGTGPDDYKDRVANDAVVVGAGSVEANAAYREVGRACDATLRTLRRSDGVRAVVRFTREKLGGSRVEVE